MPKQAVILAGGYITQVDAINPEDCQAYDTGYGEVMHRIPASVSEEF